MKTEKFATITDAETYISNSGVSEWAWGGNANLNDLIKYFWRNYDATARDYDELTERELFNSVLCDYLESAGEKIADYSLSRENLGA